MRELHIGTLVLALYCYCGDKNYNTNFFRITCFKKKQQHAGRKETQGNDKVL